MRHRRPQPSAPSHATQPRRIHPPDRTRRPPAQLTHLTAIASPRLAHVAQTHDSVAAPHPPNLTVRVCEPYGFKNSVRQSDSADSQGESNKCTYMEGARWRHG